jgi:hypothetical protein
LSKYGEGQHLFRLVRQGFGKIKEYRSMILLKKGHSSTVGKNEPNGF